MQLSIPFNAVCTGSCCTVRGVHTCVESFCPQAGGFKLPFIAVGGAMLVLVPVTFLLVGNMSMFDLIPRPHVQRKVRPGNEDY